MEKNSLSTDIIIIGSGLSGFVAACEAATKGRSDHMEKLPLIQKIVRMVKAENLPEIFKT